LTIIGGQISPRVVSRPPSPSPRPPFRPAFPRQQGSSNFTRQHGASNFTRRPISRRGARARAARGLVSRRSLPGAAAARAPRQIRPPPPPPPLPTVAPTHVPTVHSLCPPSLLLIPPTAAIVRTKRKTFAAEGDVTAFRFVRGMACAARRRRGGGAEGRWAAGLDAMVLARGPAREQPHTRAAEGAPGAAAGPPPPFVLIGHAVSFTSY
jgi:hypothetical protein